MKYFIFFFAWILTASLTKAAEPVGAIEVADPEIMLVEVQSTENGFEPNVISAIPGKAIRLKVTRSPASSCKSTFQIPEKNITRYLPQGKSTTINLGVLENGSLHFGCGKQMSFPGIIYVK